MKATFNASYEDARKVASCFVGCEVKMEGSMSDKTGELKGRSKFGFIVETDVGLFERHEITINLSSQQANIYRCMEHGLRVEVELSHAGVSKFDFNQIVDKMLLFNLLIKCSIKSIRILDIESYEGIEVEG
jgi:hypothetical protein